MALLNRPQDHRMAVVQSVVRSPGTPLDPIVRVRMESLFGRALDDVRLHTDDAAAGSVCALGAQAYTLGPHIVFDAGQYRPETTEGLWLLAHELAHVVQQSGGGPTAPLGVADASDPLECEANRVADLVVTGRSLTRGFAFGSAPAGIVQCHELPSSGAEPCNGYPSVADGPLLAQAETMIQNAYIDGFVSMYDDVFVGVQWGHPITPQDVPNRAFADEMLRTISNWPYDDRPDIIDFGRRTAYYIRRVGFYAVPDIVRIINRFHAIAHSIGSRHNEPAWVSTRAAWFPDHKLEFKGDPLKRFVCTQATNHMPPRGLILYDIRIPQQQRQRPSDFQVEDWERAYIEFGPLVRAQLPEEIPFFDPASPDYVVIVPPEFWQLKIVKEKANKEWEQLKMKAPIFVDYKQASTSAWHTYLFIMETLVGQWAGGSFVRAIKMAQRAVQVIQAIRAAAPTVAQVANKAPQIATKAPRAVQAAHKIEVVEAFDDAAKAAAAAKSSIPGFTTTQLAQGSGQWAAVQSIGSSKAVQRATSVGLMSGVLIFGNVGIAQAQGSGVTVTTDEVETIKAVPINYFQILAGVPQTFSHPSWKELRQASAPTSKKELGLGREVLYDHKRHWVMGRFKVL